MRGARGPRPFARCNGPGLILRLLLALLVLLPTSHAGAAPELQAFPGAQGAGSGTVGGRGGQVFVVTSLADSGPGSLREALTAAGPRIVVFAVGGRIWLDSRIDVLNPYLTIAGQTAPGGGIELANRDNLKEPLRIRTHDVVIRNVRIRPGPGGDRDALTLLGSEDVHHVVLDHLSLSWAVDENFDIFEDARDVTLQWSIVSEPLTCSTHPAGCLGSAVLLHGGLGISLHHNLLAHARERMPRISGSGVYDFVNNVIYNPGFTGNWGPMHIEHRSSSGLSRVNVVGNRYLPGIDSGSAAWYVDGRNAFLVYAADNEVPGALIRPGQESHLVPTPHVVTHPIRAETPQAASAAVLADAGASMGIACDGSLYPRRDPVDARVVADVGAGTGSLIDDPSQVGGWPEIDPGSPCADTDWDGLPDAWEDLHGSDPLDPTGIHGANGDVDGDCYDNIESWFNPMVDSDGDGVDDPFDNCPVHANPDQLDGDGDGYGNRCDADFNQDGVVGLPDFAALALRLETTCSDAGYELAYDLDAPVSCATGCSPAECAIGLADFARVAGELGRLPGPGRGCP